ncbi:MAG: LuxR family transcriptional regulator [Bacteroidales bacterium]|nr:LuxR family transcriptional regulator [Bacteroidales bacterium]
MKKLILLCMATILSISIRAEYRDHRGRNVDSLERVVAGWTPEREARASEEEADDLSHAYIDLMMGYRQINGERSALFARKCYNLCRRWNWLGRMSNALTGIGMIYYGGGQYDSALVYYRKAMEVTDQMAAGGYDQNAIDDCYSSLYGTIGNLYVMMDSVPKAMDYYKKAGEIFTKHGWIESNAVLWYNMGEVWFEEGDLDKALPCYETSLQFARASGDSLLLSGAYKGLGSYYLAKGKTGRALRYIREADSYYSLHQDQEFRARIETLGLLRQISDRQKNQWKYLALGGAIILLLLLGMTIILRRNRKLSREKEGADIVIEEALSETPPEEALSAREKEILPLIAAGLTSQQIADKIYLSLPTIKWYRKRLFEKLGATNAADLISKAKEKGLI